MLSVGSRAPIEDLASMNGERGADKSDLRGKRCVVVFLPPEVTDALAAQLGRYAENCNMFDDQGAVVMVLRESPASDISDAPNGDSISLATYHDLDGAIAAGFGVVTGGEPVLPAVFVVDEEAVVRAAFDALRYPTLPSPVAVVRVLRRLSDVPRAAPVGESDWCRGPSDATVDLIVYSDYQCGRCQALHAALETLAADTPALIRLVHRHLPLRATHPLAQMAAEAAEAAGAQGRFWEMNHRLYEAQGALDVHDLVRYAAELGLDLPRFTRELSERAHEEAVADDLRRAIAGRIKLPPTLFVSGVMYEGQHTAEALRQHIHALAMR